MRKRKIIGELERIAKYNYHVESLLKLHKEGKPLDQAMLEMITVMAFDTYSLRESLNRERSK